MTLAEKVPLSGDGGRNLAQIEGYEPRQGEDMEFNSNIVGPEYFEVMGVPLVRGRGFATTDRAGAPQVAIVNEAFAARYWPGENPLGKRLAFFDGAESIEIVGSHATASIRRSQKRHCPISIGRTFSPTAR